jgi:hypothetical protein
VIVHRITDKMQDDYFEISHLDEYDLENLERLSAVEVWYWYESASYEGDGRMLLRNENNEYALWNMGHCSCYGPLDHINDDSLYFMDAKTMYENQSEEEKKNTGILFRHAVMDMPL